VRCRACQVLILGQPPWTRNLQVNGQVVVTVRHSKAASQAFAQLDGAQALALAGGVALFLVGDVLLRRTLKIGPSRWRTALAVRAPATILLGVVAAAVAQLVTLVGLLLMGFAAEHPGTGRRD